MNNNKNFNITISRDDQFRLVITQFNPEAASIILPLGEVDDFIKLVVKASIEASVQSTLRGASPGSSITSK
jgi:hypothetical protein